MKKQFNLYPTLLMLVLPFCISAQAPIRVVCVGNSITEGYGLKNAAIQAWPAQLNNLLGSGYAVYNCGASGTRMSKKGPSPYWNDGRFTNAIKVDLLK